jgi:dTDP-4-dehydrorhamnose reductase
VNDSFLILGGDGLLGSALHRHWKNLGREVVITTRTNSAERNTAIKLDLSQTPNAWPSLPQCRVAVLCAAITSLEICRSRPTETRQVNVVHTLELARHLVRRGIFVVFISSNLVFDGNKPFRKLNEPPSPQTEYGRQKTETENGLKELKGETAVIRLTKVVHPNLPLLCSWRESLRQGQAIHPFTDFVCSPIGLLPTVRAIAKVAEGRLSGVWHLSGNDDITYAAIGRLVAEYNKFDPSLVQPAFSRDRAHLEHQPAHSTLDASRAREDLGFEILDPATAIIQHCHS